MCGTFNPRMVIMDATFWTLLAQRGPVPALIGALIVLLGLFVRAILTGRLVPRSAVDDVRADRAQRLTELAKERDDWKHAHAVSEETRTIMARQVEKLLSTAELTNQLLISFKAAAKDDDQ